MKQFTLSSYPFHRRALSSPAVQQMTVYAPTFLFLSLSRTCSADRLFELGKELLAIFSVKYKKFVSFESTLLDPPPSVAQNERVIDPLLPSCLSSGSSLGYTHTPLLKDYSSKKKVCFSYSPPASPLSERLKSRRGTISKLHNFGVFVREETAFRFNPVAALFSRQERTLSRTISNCFHCGR